MTAIVVLCLTLTMSIEAPVQDTVRVSSDLVIGVADGADPYVLGYVTGIGGDNSGDIYVSDIQASRVHVYDSTGAFRMTVGRFGQGPGEMQRPAALTILKEDMWAISDLGLDAYLWFDSDGEFRVRHRRPYRASVLDEIRSGGAGGLFDARRGRSRVDSAFYVLRIRLDDEMEMMVDSVLIDAIPETFVPLTDRESGFDGGAFTVPFAPYTVWAAAEDGVLFSADGSYVIEKVRFAGQRDTLIAHHEVPAQIPDWVSEDVFRTPRSQLRTLAERVGIRPDEWLDQVHIPDRFPAVIRLLTDPFGRIWVLGADSSGEPKLDVWDSTGAYQGTMILDTETWPALDVMGISGTHVLGRFEMETGVHQVRGFKIPPFLRR